MSTCASERTIGALCELGGTRYARAPEPAKERLQVITGQQVIADVIVHASDCSDVLLA